MNALEEARRYYATDSKEMFPSQDPDVQGQREGTTFYADFKVAEAFSAVEHDTLRDTWRRAWNGCKNNVKYLVELAVVLNHLCWEHYNAGRHTLGAWYSNKFYFVQNRIYASGSEDEPLPEGCRPFTEEEHTFAFQVLD